MAKNYQAADGSWYGAKNQKAATDLAWSAQYYPTSGSGVKNKTLKQLSSGSLTMLATWECTHKHIKEFRVDIQKYYAKGNVTSEGLTVKANAQNSAGGAFQCTFNAPNDVNCTKVAFRVHAVAQSRTVSISYPVKKEGTRKVPDGTNKDGSVKYKTEKYTYYEKKWQSESVPYWYAAWSGWREAANPAIAIAAAKAASEKLAEQLRIEAEKRKAPSAAPATPTASLQANGTVRVQWSRPSEAQVSEVTVFRCQDGAGMGGIVRVGAFGPATVEMADAGVAPGHEYRYCLLHRNGYSNTCSSYGALSEPVQTMPLAPTGLRASCVGANAALLEWADNGYRYCGTAYRVRYARSVAELSGNANTATTLTPDLQRVGSANRLQVGDLPAGGMLFFQVQLVGTAGNSAWSGIASCLVGSTPEAPTLAQGPASYMIGDVVAISWTHNCEDASAQEGAAVQVRVNSGSAETYQAGAAESYAYGTSSLSDGDVLSWRVRTKGVMPDYGPWSQWMEATVYAVPVVGIEAYCAADGGERADTGGGLSSLPLVVALTVGGTLRQQPVTWALEVSPAEDFDYVTATGDAGSMRAGHPMLAAYRDANDADFSRKRQVISIGAQDGVFAEGVALSLRAMAVMDSGLRSEWAEAEVVPDWESGLPNPTASALVLEDYTVAIWPECEDARALPEGEAWMIEGTRLTVGPEGVVSAEVSVAYTTAYEGAQAEHSFGVVDLPLEADMLDVDPAFGAISSVTVGGTAYAEGAVYDAVDYVEDVLLSVFRLDAGGGATLLAEGIPNGAGKVVVDRYPAFGTSWYRVVANSQATDEVTFADTSVELPYRFMLLQWGRPEAYVSDDFPDGALVTLSESVELELNFAVTESTSKDATANMYAGLDAPVVDFGTHIGESVRYSASFMAWDGSVLSKLRSLKRWNGPVHARDRTGLSFWCSMDVSISQANSDGGIRVQLDATPMREPVTER